MATQLSFKDLNITFKKHPVTNDVVVSRDESAIKQAIVNLLLTNKGERLMNPRYGSDIRSYLFEPLDYGTAARVRSDINYCVTNFEPRIKLVQVLARPDIDRNSYHLTIMFYVIGTSEPVTVEAFLERLR